MNDSPAGQRSFWPWTRSCWTGGTTRTPTTHPVSTAWPSTATNCHLPDEAYIGAPTSLVCRDTVQEDRHGLDRCANGLSSRLQSAAVQLSGGSPAWLCPQGRSTKTSCRPFPHLSKGCPDGMTVGSRNSAADSHVVSGVFALAIRPCVPHSLAVLVLWTSEGSAHLSDLYALLYVCDGNRGRCLSGVRKSSRPFRQPGRPLDELVQRDHVQLGLQSSFTDAATPFAAGDGRRPCPQASEGVRKSVSYPR